MAAKTVKQAGGRGGGVGGTGALGLNKTRLKSSTLSSFHPNLKWAHWSRFHIFDNFYNYSWHSMYGHIYTILEFRNSRKWLKCKYFNFVKNIRLDSQNINKEFHQISITYIWCCSALDKSEEGRCSVKMREHTSYSGTEPGQALHAHGGLTPFQLEVLVFWNRIAYVVHLIQSVMSPNRKQSPWIFQASVVLDWLRINKT